MIYLIGLWGNVLPGLLLLLLVWRVAERFEPGYGVAAAVVLGLGTMVLPFSRCCSRTCSPRSSASPPSG